MPFRYLIVPVSLLLATSCARIPEPIDYTHSVQQKMQAAHHWDVLALDLAKKINNELVRLDYLDTALSVRPTCGDDNHVCSAQEVSPFSEAFRDMLLTDLVQYGVPTRKKTGDDCLEVQYKVQTVRHNASRIRSLQPGLITSLTAAVLVLRNAPDELLTMAGAGLADYANQAMVGNSHYEVIITTSLAQKDTYLFRSTDIYYINDTDFSHYLEAAHSSATISLSSGQSTTTALPAGGHSRTAAVQQSQPLAVTPPPTPVSAAPLAPAAPLIITPKEDRIIEEPVVIRPRIRSNI